MQICESIKDRISDRLEQLYPGQADRVFQRLCDLMDRHADNRTPQRNSRWDERDVMLITYGDQVFDAGRQHSPLDTLSEFLEEFDLASVINIVHLLPFFPYSSDDGFSVIDYRAVDPNLGTWEDIHHLHRQVDLMFDLVLNHLSQQSQWFQSYLAGEAPFRDFFIEADPATDLSAVTRPRSLPLLTRYETHAGERHLWTTFSDDQIDLNYANPEVLLAILETLLFYVSQGARFIRLDAVAYLWKQIGTNCIHLPETHTVVKVMRDVLDCVAPDVVLLTETNVPHHENVSYFGDGDEAHMVYQFSLPPLLLDALVQHDAGPFTNWLKSLETTPPGTTFFNFTASHDGVGVRPLEGLVSADRVQQLMQWIRQRGGQISTKRNPDGSDTPYELNISYVSALSEPQDSNTATHANRFLCSQAVMLALRGIPGIYFHSLVGSLNDIDGMQQSGVARRINRQKFAIETLREQLRDPTSLSARVLAGYRHLLQTRIAQPAFHPDGPQQSVDVDQSALVAFHRRSPGGEQQLLIAANLSNSPCELNVAEAGFATESQDLLSGQSTRQGRFVLQPYQVAWLKD